MAFSGVRLLLIIFVVIDAVTTVERQIFDFLGFMWLPIIFNFINILLIIFGLFGTALHVVKYLVVFAVWSFIWLFWNIFLICYYLNIGNLNRESSFLSLGTGSVSWWETNGWGCQAEWGEVDRPELWRPVRVEGCLVQWQYVEIAQCSMAILITIVVLPLTVILTHRIYKAQKTKTGNGKSPHRPVYTIELSPTENNISESSLKPMTPRRVKRRSGSRGAGSSVRRSRRSYRNAAYSASSTSLSRESRLNRPASAHSSYSNFHPARPSSYHGPEKEIKFSQDPYDPPPPLADSVPIVTNRYENLPLANQSTGYDVVGPYNEPNYAPRKYEHSNMTYEISNGFDVASCDYDTRIDMVSPSESSMYGGTAYAAGSYASSLPPPPAPPYCARATPQAPGPPAYQTTLNDYNHIS